MDERELEKFECLVERVLTRVVEVYAADEDEAESLVLDGEGWMASEQLERERIVCGPYRPDDAE